MKAPADPLGREAAAVSMAAGTRPPPLAGMRVIAVEQYGAGPFGTMYLADLGADVIKIEDPSAGGDVSRYIPPGQDGEDSLFFEAFNRGKRSVALDLKSSAGQEVMARLVESADVVYSNLRGDQPARLGLTYDVLGKINPAIVCVALTGYGRTGPDATLPAYDALIQAQAGWAAMTGGPEDAPTKSGLSLVDYVAGLTSVVGLFAGVLDARRTGIGRDVDANLYDSALAMLTYPATWLLSGGYVTKRRPMSAHASVVPFQFFATADGYIAVACPKEKFFRALVDAMDLTKLLNDSRFRGFRARDAHRDELLAVLTPGFLARTTSEWLGLLQGRVPVAPVRSLEEALGIDELDQRGMLAIYPHATFGEVRSIGLPLSIGGFSPEYRAAPRLGADRRSVLEALGYDITAEEDLAARGAFGIPPKRTVDLDGATPSATRRRRRGRRTRLEPG